MLDNSFKAIIISLPLHRLVSSNQNSEITFALLQMQSLPSPLPPLYVGRPAELPSLLQHCPPQRGSKFTLLSRFHPRSGGLQSANANDLLLPHLKTCQRSSNLTYSLRTRHPELQLRSVDLRMNPPHRLLLSILRPRLMRYLVFFSWIYVVISLSRVGPQNNFSFACIHILFILSSDSYTSSPTLGSIYCVILHRLLHFSHLPFSDPHL